MCSSTADNSKGIFPTIQPGCMENTELWEGVKNEPQFNWALLGEYKMENGPNKIMYIFNS